MVRDRRQWCVGRQLESKQCQYTSAQASAKHGTTTPAFVYTLFDLQTDPFEQHNLYDVGTVELETVKAELYKGLAAVHARAAHDHFEGDTQFMNALYYIFYQCTH